MPLQYDIIPETTYANQGVPHDVGTDYELTAYDSDGEAKQVSFTYDSEDSTSFPQAGGYTLVEASEQVVTGQKVDIETDVPQRALDKIKVSL
ncbi:DUF1093 domain-containing protein [Flaviflexus ciconiae]|uniref:DUF1093 domain-containing protein n=1 Tax=Flaviflexus ciconiae TaxID=2496867 RepID=A0A3S9PXH5_9ACTO|nr:DUF1093 domain-containing protein [Flaviflexus ciconiae]AZQ77026.1 DUF1093 domain-containing protein [Flaviflexus ciconiae]